MRMIIHIPGIQVGNVREINEYVEMREALPESAAESAAVLTALECR